MNAILRHRYAPATVLGVTAIVAMLAHDSPVSAVTCDPSYFPAPDAVFFRSAAVSTSRFDQPTTFWAGFALLTTDGTTDFDLFMYNNCTGGYLAGSNWGLGRTDFVLGDFNYNPTNADNAVDIPCYSGNCGAPYAGAATWRTGGFLFVDFPPTTVDFTANVPPYNPDMIMHVWDVFLTSGSTYYFQFSSSLGSGMKMLLFRNPNQGTYWTGRSGAEFEVTGCTSYTAPATGYYGLVVVNDAWALGSYTVGVTTQPTCACADPLPEATPVAVPASPTTAYRWAPLQQYANGWEVIGERPATGSDWDLEVSSGGSPPGCGQSLLANSVLGGNAVDFVMTDFSYVSPIDLAARTYRYSGGGGTTCEWNGTVHYSNYLQPNGQQVYQAWGANDVLQCWTITMYQGEEYTFEFSASSNMRLFLFRNPGNGLYSAGRTGAVVQATSTISYTAPADGNYGVVVAKDDDQSGYFALRVGTCIDAYALPAGAPLTGVGPAFMYFSIEPTQGHWQAFGTRCLTADWDMKQYGSTTSAAWPDCYSPLGAVSESGSVPDFIVGDFNVNTPGIYPFQLKQFSGGDPQAVDLEWTGPATTIGVNDPAINANPSAYEVLRIYQAFLVGGRGYQISYGQSATRPLLVFANATGSEYWAPRSAALLSTLGSTAFTPPSSGTYAFVIANDAAESGSFALRITTTSSVDAPESKPRYVTRLGEITPNPAAVAPTIHFSLATPSRVRFDLLDLTGRRVWSSGAGDYAAGEWRIPLNRDAAGEVRLSAGVYFVHFVVNDRPTEVRKMVMLE